MGHALPLRSERDAEELRIEAQVVFKKLSVDCGVNSDQVHADYAGEIDSIAHNLDSAKEKPRRGALSRRPLDAAHADLVLL